jgi:UDP-N-acetylglucosamine--N-acetylmuramyl-(pentapeptide) pyrophosphoryl-undecaprenol N-acetylglucosamine transferase
MPTPSANSHHALLAGGGTGGHVYPALAVAEALHSRGWRVTFVGRPQGFERRVATAHGLAYEALPAAPLVGRGPVGKAIGLLRLGSSVIAGRRLVRRLEADIAIGTGGYVSAPAVLGAHWAGRPTLLLEPNATPGVANRVLSRWADGAVVAWEEGCGELRCPIWETGVPVRREFFEDPAALPAAPPLRLLIIGGSQGARQINRLMPRVVATLRARGLDLDVLHQSGAAMVNETREEYEVRDQAVDVVAYIEDMAAAMKRAHFVVSRAGAITIAELCAAGRPSLLLPLSIATGHQVHNARALQARGGALVLSGENIALHPVSTALGELLTDPERLAEMSRAARSLAHPDAADRIADRVENLVGGEN